MYSSGKSHDPESGLIRKVVCSGKWIIVAYQEKWLDLKSILIHQLFDLASQNKDRGCGQAAQGKLLTAKAIARSWGMPLVRLVFSEAKGWLAF